MVTITTLATKVVVIIDIVLDHQITDLIKESVKK